MNLPTIRWDYGFPQSDGPSVESCGIALHYQTADTQAEATMEAMSHALERVSAGFAAAGQASLLTLGSAWRSSSLYLDERAAELDLSVVEDRTGANGDSTESPAAERTL
ncbi:hypothetical protein ABZ896_12360 [Streptomyces sp. NPDC047072]|uniref:hypothetical protein n=1 Tax=Streptomyces sp. NPDC047072 TaxID=3154809 RepID=UPI0033F860B1